MKYPSSLLPTATETVELSSGKAVEISKALSVFKPWRGKPITDTYGGKAILSFYRKPEFAELGILRIFQQDGWGGVWVDTYRRKFRTHYWPQNEVSLPKKRALLLNLICEAAGSPSGCFDVFCWKGRNYLFIESKRSAKDRLQISQKHWIESALKCGVPRESLLIVEWRVSA